MLADKLHNLGSMLADLEAGQDLWARFHSPPEKILWYYREMLAAAFQNDARLAGLAQECADLIARLSS